MHSESTMVNFVDFLNHTTLNTTAIMAVMFFIIIIII